MANDTATNYRLKTIGIVGLLFFALIADLLSLIPFVGDLVGPIFWIGASIYLYIKGFGFINSRRLATSAISLIGELIPVVQELPLILAGAIAIVILSRIEDRLGLSFTKKGKVNTQAFQQAVNKNGRREVLGGDEKWVNEVGDGVRNLRFQPPLNQDGVRRPTRA